MDNNVAECPDRNELIRKWRDALRSGEFPQGNSCLRDDSGYCCLGVLCVVAGLMFQRHADNKYAVVASPNGHLESHYLPKWLAEYIRGGPAREDANAGDLQLHVPERFGGWATPSHYNASKLNDEAGFMFDQIADCIEATWPEAFAV